MPRARSLVRRRSTRARPGLVAKRPRTGLRIVGIGASAGGLEALERLLRALPADPGTAYVVVQHLNPRFESQLSAILSRCTPMPVAEAQDGVRIRPGHVYTIPPRYGLLVKGSRLQLQQRDGARARFMPIDDMLRSLAESAGPNAVAVILSGTASDGANGVRAIKAGGGTTYSQDSESARHFGMPQAAIGTGLVDYVLTPEDIARSLAGIAPVVPLQSGAGPLHGELFRELKRAFGVDFTAYKQTAVQRRVRRRLAQLGISRLEDYLRYLRSRPDELRRLYQDMFVGVTGFFREPETFAMLRKHVFPRIVREHDPQARIRMWVPGCSTGEEVYSIAISLLEYLRSRAGSVPIQIFGTDVNEEAVKAARAGTYSAEIAGEVGQLRLQRFFHKSSGGYQVSQAVRDCCVFATHDVQHDAPFSRLDLVDCRNLLMYLAPAVQRRLIPLLHYSLSASRYLLLGSADTTVADPRLFRVVDPGSQIYAKKPAVVLPPLDLTRGGSAQHAIERAAAEARARSDVEQQREAADLILLNHHAAASVLVNEDAEILQFRGQTGSVLEPAVGAASLNLMRMAKEGLLNGIRAALESARRTGAAAESRGLALEANGHVQSVDVHVVPVRVPEVERLSYLVVFRLVPEPEANAPLARSTSDELDRKVSRLKDELLASKSYLQAMIEDHESHSEDLRATNEELTSTNQELQSTAEELQTSNEELQSAIEELNTVNEELQHGNAELKQAHADILNLLSAIQMSVLILDRELRIRRLTPVAEQMLGLRPSDVGRPLADIRLRIEVKDLERLARDAIAVAASHDRELQDRSGRWFSVQVRPYLSEGVVDGALLAVSDIHAVKLAEERFRVALLHSPALVFTQDCELRYTWIHHGASAAWAGLDALGKTDAEVFSRREADELDAIKQRVLRSGRGARDLVQLTLGGRQRWFDLTVEPLTDSSGRIAAITCATWDVTEQTLAQDDARRAAVLEERNRLAREVHDSLAQGLVGVVLRLEAAEQLVAAEPARAPAEVRGVREQVREILDEARRSLLALRPRLLERGTLASALDQLAVDVGAQTQATVRSALRGKPRPLERAVEENLLRVAQEALHNAVRHSGARHVRVELAFNEQSLRLRVDDDGRGFDTSSSRGSGIGLGVMRERVSQIGGEIEFDSKPGRGTTVEVRLRGART